MLDLKRKYSLDVKLAKLALIGHPRCPVFPEGLWNDVLLNRYIDLNKIYLGYYVLDVDYRHTQMGN